MKKTFVYESFMNHKFYYDIDDKSITYRTKTDKPLRVEWNEIKDIEYYDKKAKIKLLTKKENKISISYFTHGFPELIETILVYVSLQRYDRSIPQYFYPDRFSVFCKYFIMLIFVIFVVGLFVTTGFLKCFYLVASVFFLCLILAQYKEVVVYNSHLITKSFLNKKRYKYNEVKKIHIKKGSDRYSPYLYLLLELNSGKKIIFPRFRNILCMFTLIRNYKSSC